MVSVNTEATLEDKTEARFCVLVVIPEIAELRREVGFVVTESARVRE